MKNNRYHKAMDQLPFSKDLEAKTLALLKASSTQSVKEEDTMNQVEKPNRPRWNPQKALTIGGSVLAAAAVLVLIFTPVLRDATQVTSPVEVAKHNLDATLNSEPLATQIAIAGQAASSAKQLDSVSAQVQPVAPSAVQNAPASMTDDMGMEFFEVDFGAPSGRSFMFSTAPSPVFNTNEYSHIQETRFLSTQASPLSTFAADVDTASYAQLRAAILAGNPVAADSVRIEEMLNYFHYTYAQPKDGEPFGVTTEVAPCPWNKDTQLLLIGLQAKEVDTANAPAQNLVFLIDVSGSMDDPDKLPLVKRSFGLLLEELKPTDSVSIVTYAGADQVVLDGVKASHKTDIMAAIDDLFASGGTAGAAGINTAYEIAKKHFITGGSNRVILATDGDLNIGVSDEGSLTRLVEEKRKEGVYLSVLGFGYGNYKDNKLEALADNGNGNYAYIDTIHEARKALVEEIGGTFLTVAKDVKLQVEFNPSKIKGYRLIGYENRTLAAEDFADDAKDGGELGSGHRVTALYELVPMDSAMEIPSVETKYQNASSSASSEWLTVNVRAKEPDGDISKLYSYPVDSSAYHEIMSDNLRFAAAVAEFGMLLRDSQWKGTATYAQALDLLRGTGNLTGDVYKEELLYLMTQAQRNPS